MASNDAMVALLIASRLGQHVLTTSAADPSVRLPVLFRQLQGIDRLNVTSARASELLGSSEELLVKMAIPYVISVHEAFLADAIEMLKADGRDPESSAWTIPRSANVEKIDLSKKHAYIAERAGIRLPERDLELFELARMIRNRIVHYAGDAGSKLETSYRQLSKDARDRWLRLAGRQLTVEGGSNAISLREGELRVTLSTAMILGVAVNESLARSLSRTYWADLVVDDYRAEYPKRFGDRARRQRRISGFAGERYNRLKLTEEELRRALEKSEGCSSH